MICSERGIGNQCARQQPHPTDLGNDQRFDAASHCFRVIVIKGDERIRAKRGDLPEEEHEKQTSTEDESRHCANEEQHEGVIAAQLSLTLHIIYREDDSQRTHHAGDGCQSDGESIGGEGEAAEEGTHRNVHCCFSGGEEDQG